MGNGGTPPVANFSGSPQSGEAPLAVQFSDLSTGPPVSWLWSFGDGATSSSQNPTHVYQTTGYKTVSLTVMNSYGSDSETKSNYINVGTPQVYCYYAGKNYTPGQMVCIESDRYTCQNTGNWTLTTANDPSCGFTPSFKKVCLKNKRPSKCTPETPMTLTDTTPAIDGTPVSYHTDFGDGSTSDSYNPTHIYKEPGDYTITYTVCYDDSGVFDGNCYTVEDNVHIFSESPPVAIALVGIAIFGSVGYIYMRNK